MTSLSDVATGAYNKDLVLEDVIIGLFKDEKNKRPAYFAYDPKNPELVVRIEDYPGKNIDFDNILITHYHQKDIPVTVIGGSSKGILYICEAYKEIAGKKTILVTSSDQGYLE